MQAATPINIVTGNYEFPCLIIIDDEEWWDRYGRQVEANWETLRIRRYSSLDTAGLAALATDPTWSNEGLFAFLEGLRRLAVIDIAGRTAAPAVEVEFWMADNWHIGNAATDGEDFRGWIVGHFINGDTAPIRTSEDVEIKWSVHPAGEERASWQSAEHRTTALILIAGRFHIDSSVDSYTLSKQGDYAMWCSDVGHSWRAISDSSVVTIRWPSTSI